MNWGWLLIVIVLLAAAWYLYFRGRKHAQQVEGAIKPSGELSAKLIRPAEPTPVAPPKKFSDQVGVYCTCNQDPTPEEVSANYCTTCGKMLG